MQEYHIKGNGGIGMLKTMLDFLDEASISEGYTSWYHVYSCNDLNYSDLNYIPQRAGKLYLNQGIQQVSEVCSEMLTDGFIISNVPAVLALKEEI